MKKVWPIFAMTITSIVGIVATYRILDESSRVNLQNKDYIANANKVEKKAENKKENKKEDVPSPTPIVEEIVYDGLTMNQLSDKLNRVLQGVLSGYGNLFANYSIQLGIDPYLSVAIVMHETGCAYSCSTLVKRCNNVGGMKGTPKCQGGSYKAFPTLEDGIRSYLENLYYNYYRIGLTTPETIGPKYAESKAWPSYIHKYIEKIKMA